MIFEAGQKLIMIDKDNNLIHEGKVEIATTSGAFVSFKKENKGFECKMFIPEFKDKLDLKASLTITGMWNHPGLVADIKRYFSEELKMSDADIDKSILDMKKTHKIDIAYCEDDDKKPFQVSLNLETMDLVCIKGYIVSAQEISPNWFHNMKFSEIVSPYF